MPSSQPAGRFAFGFTPGGRFMCSKPLAMVCGTPLGIAILVFLVLSLVAIVAHLVYTVVQAIPSRGERARKGAAAPRAGAGGCPMTAFPIIVAVIGAAVSLAAWRGVHWLSSRLDRNDNRDRGIK